VPHDSGTFTSVHPVGPGAQTPTHAPLTHVWSLHADPIAHCPSGPHVSGALPSQPACPDSQTPARAPEMHVWSTHAHVVSTVTVFDPAYSGNTNPSRPRNYAITLRRAHPGG
jgi:hypothetical protein